LRAQKKDQERQKRDERLRQYNAKKEDYKRKMEAKKREQQRKKEENEYTKQQKKIEPKREEPIPRREEPRREEPIPRREEPKREEPKPRREEPKRDEPRPERTKAEPVTPSPPPSFATNNMGVARPAIARPTPPTSPSPVIYQPVKQEKPQLKERVVSLRPGAIDGLNALNRVPKYEKNEMAPTPSLKKLPAPVKKTPADPSKFAQPPPSIPAKAKVGTSSVEGSPKKWPDPVTTTTQVKPQEPVNKTPPTFDRSGIVKANSSSKSLVPPKPMNMKNSSSKQDADEEDESRFRKGMRNEMLVQAKHNYTATREDELDMIQGDIITVIQEEDQDGWAYGEVEGKQGYFPYSFVKKYDPRATLFFGNDLNEKTNEDQFVMLNCHLDSGEVKNIKVKRTIKYDDLLAKISKALKITDLWMQYPDDDGDLLTVADASDLDLMFETPDSSIDLYCSEK